ncbi:facilitated trehalose transporter Tret1-like [Manduca sexta]|uniref:facilitated trehalose transporter Tret1-like n=1 Tax=Manduca sexta TaxID=7130 RepID=UPI00188FFE73|nr:facilitated trehalose transporter Tret1-like [Manduca sexta]
MDLEIANFLSAYLVDKIGRKYCIILSCVPKILVGLLFTFASEVWMLMLGRALLGISDAFVFTVVPIYASEIASKEIRGALGTILQILCSLGVVIMLCMGPFISYVNLNVIFTVFTIVSTIPLIFLPDSPYFLYSKGKNKEAFEVLKMLRGTEILANEELKEYALEDHKVDVKITELFRNRIFLKSFGIVIFIGILIQAIGFNSISFYLQTILESTKTSVKPEVASVIIGIIQLVASVCTTLVTDRFGRKPILSTTLVGMTVGMIGLGVFFKLKDSGPISGAMNFLPIVSLILVVFGYSAVWVLTAELFEDSARGIGICLSSVLSYISLFLMTKYFEQMVTAIGPAVTYWIFSVNGVIFTLFILFCIPETKGKSFSEIQIALGAKDRNIAEEKTKC